MQHGHEETGEKSKEKTPAKTLEEEGAIRDPLL